MRPLGLKSTISARVPTGPVVGAARAAGWVLAVRQQHLPFPFTWLGAMVHHLPGVPGGPRAADDATTEFGASHQPLLAVFAV
jgi:hypothetical protein